MDDNTIVVFTTDNGTEVLSWPDGGQTLFAQSKGTMMECDFPRPCDDPLARPSGRACERAPRVVLSRPGRPARSLGTNAASKSWCCAMMVGDACGASPGVVVIGALLVLLDARLSE